MAESKILKYVSEHESYRSRGINLVVSENFLSEGVRRALGSDLAGRYYATWYGGSAVARRIVERTEELAAELFQVKHALVLALSGNVCDLAALFAFTRPGDKVAILPFTAGGYPFGIGKFQRERRYLPADEETLSIDVEAAKRLIRDEEVKLTFLGASGIPFPHPVKEISECIKEAAHPGVCVYDGSHVLGLIACGTFQDPLSEGADVLIGSTHKSFYGPQGGLILTNSDEHAEALNRYLDFDIEEGFGLMDNPHVNRIAALGVAIEEMLEDPGYGSRVVKNAKALARALKEREVPVKFEDRDFTESHQVLLDLDLPRAEELCRRLEEVAIFTDLGARLGTAEATHRGMDEGAMNDVAAVVAEVYHHGPNDSLRKRVRKLAGLIHS